MYINGYPRKMITRKESEVEPVRPIVVGERMDFDEEAMMNGDAGPTSEERAVADVEVIVNGNDHSLETGEGEEREEEDEDEAEQGEVAEGYEDEEAYDQAERDAQTSLDPPPAPPLRKAKELEPEEARHRPREPLSRILQSLQTVSSPLLLPLLLPLPLPLTLTSPQNHRSPS